MALLPWALVEPCAKLPAVERLPVLFAAAKSYYRVLVAFARVLSDSAALLRQAAVCEFASAALLGYARSHLAFLCSSCCARGCAFQNAGSRCCS